MSDIQVPVLIVGGGSAGLSASIFLSSYGIDHLLVERHESTSILPKAHYLNLRTMEILRQFGVADSVYELGAPMEHMGKVAWRTSLAGDGPLDAKTFYKMDAFGGGELAETYERDSPCPSTNLPQLRLEPILRKHAEQRNPGNVRFGHELTEMTQDAEGGTATIRDIKTSETHSVRADYLIGADGGKTVGAMIGATMVGMVDVLDIVSAHFTADLSQWAEDDTLITHFCNPEGGGQFDSGIMVPMGPTWGKHSEEWAISFACMPGDADLDEQTVLPRIRQLLRVGDHDITINKVSHWLVNGIIVDKYQEGRVFLVGDSAHKHPPTTGLGLNTCMQDSHNLAWKLAAVIKGQASASLLDTYQTERQPVGMRIVDWAMFTFQNHFVVDGGMGLLPIPVPPEVYQGIFGVFFSDTPMGATRRARFEEVVKTQRCEFQAHDLEIGFSYQSGALVPDGSTPPPSDPMGSIYYPTTRPGHRLPHAWVERGGERISTHDLAGAGGDFVLITGPDCAEWSAAAAATAEKFGIGITVAAIGSDIADLDGQWAEVRDIADGGAVLVRPDNHVAWRSAESSEQAADSLMHAVGAVLVR